MFAALGMGPPLPPTAPQTNPPGSYYPGTPINEPPRLDTNPALFEPRELLQEEALQQGDETFGSYGKCKQFIPGFLKLQRDTNRRIAMLNLLFEEPPRGWGMEDISLGLGIDLGDTSSL